MNGGENGDVLKKLRLAAAAFDLVACWLSDTAEFCDEKTQRDRLAGVGKQLRDELDLCSVGDIWEIIRGEGPIQ